MTDTAVQARYQGVQYRPARGAPLVVGVWVRRERRLLHHNELSHPLFDLVDALQEANELNTQAAPRARRNRS